jgi:hypothetical protein
MLAQDDAALKLQLQTEAKTLTTTLWEILAPHFCNQSAAARTFRMSSGRSEEELHEVFEQYITPALQSALHHKLKLLATDCDYTYHCPPHGAGYDPGCMDIYGAQEHLPLDVRFTVFPGLTAVTDDGDANVFYPLVKVEMHFSSGR